MKLACLLVFGMLPMAHAALVDLGVPGGTETFGNALGSTDLSIIIQPVSNFSLSAAGIIFGPLTGGATEIRLDVFSLDSGGARSSLPIASATAPVLGGITFHDVSLASAVTLLGGVNYDVAFSSTAAGGWGTGLNTMAIYKFNNPTGTGPDSPYTVAGLITVIDGARGGNRFTENMPHVRLNAGSTPPGVPEPGSFALLGIGLAALALARRGTGRLVRRK